MKYLDGSHVRLGDRIELRPNLTGIVVCSVDTNEFSEAYPKEEWADYLKIGVLIETNEIGLLHLDENSLDHDLRRV